jgi:hypothetical protein
METQAGWDEPNAWDFFAAWRICERLLQYEASDSYGGILLIPFGGNMFERDLEFAAQAGV